MVELTTIYLYNCITMTRNINEKWYGVIAYDTLHELPNIGIMFMAHSQEECHDWINSYLLKGYITSDYWEFIVEQININISVEL